MRKRKSIILSGAALALFALALAGCTAADNANSNTTATTSASPPVTASPSPQNLTVAGRPQKITDEMAKRGEQDEAKPALRFASPRDGETINSSTVNVKLELSGDLKGYKPLKDPATGMGNHIHIILNNQPYEAYYDLMQPFELRNVAEGKHTLRVFASRPWHESYKNPESFQMVTFTVKGGSADASKPTTTNSGQVMADNKNANASASPAAPREGKEMAPTTAGEVDAAKPLLTYSRPKGEYKGADADAIMIDFWLKNGKLQSEGGEYRVRYAVDGGEAKFIDKWEPIWLTGWTGGKHTVKLELVGKDGNPVDNGGYNMTTREITVTR
ncbi:MAG: hypothetical protein H7Y30_03795 [Pyrinomonadaceae bacterium]|nr:hypothetical protein [Pyrinomonadaceae bacterium]